MVPRPGWAFLEDIIEDVVEEVFIDIIEDVVEDVYKEVFIDIVEDVVEDVYKKVCEDVIKEVCKEVCEDVCEDVFENVYKEVCEEVVEERGGGARELERAQLRRLEEPPRELGGERRACAHAQLREGNRRRGGGGRGRRGAPADVERGDGRERFEELCERTRVVGPVVEAQRGDARAGGVQRGQERGVEEQRGGGGFGAARGRRGAAR